MMDVNVLKKYQQQATLIAFYGDCDNTDTFSVGKILSVDDDFVLLGCVTPTGEYDGCCVYRTDHCILIEQDTQYLKKIETLCGLKHTKWEEMKIGDHILDTTLQYAIDQNYCVSIELCDSGFYDVQGRVRSLSTEYMTVDCLTDFGLPNGMAHIPLAQITKVRINAVEEQTVNLLYNRESKSQA